MALDGLYGLLRRHFGPGKKVNLVRFADDFIITGANANGTDLSIRQVAEFANLLASEWAWHL